MTREEMNRLIEEHLAAEQAQDMARAVGVYTDDVEHDLVGTPHGPLHGRQAAREFYEHLFSDINTEQMIPVRAYYGDDFCVIEHDWTGTVPGSFLGVAGNGRRITFRLLHIFEFRDGLISRENAWMDVAAILGQLTATDAAAPESVSA